MTVGICMTREIQDVPYDYPLIMRDEGKTSGGITMYFYTTNPVLPINATISQGTYTCQYTDGKGSSYDSYRKYSIVQTSINYNVSKRLSGTCNITLFPILYDFGGTPMVYGIKETVTGTLTNGVITFSYKKPSNVNHDYHGGYVIVGISF